MFYYIYQPHTPSFPVWLVKTKSHFIFRSVETGLGRWTLVVAVITVDAYPFLAFPDLTCHLQDMRIGVALSRLIVGRQILEVATKRLLHKQASRTWKCVPTSISGCVDISEVPGRRWLQQMSSQWELQIILQELVSHQLTSYLSVFDTFLSQ